MIRGISEHDLAREWRVWMNGKGYDPYNSAGEGLWWFWRCRWR